MKCTVDFEPLYLGTMREKKEERRETEQTIEKIILEDWRHVLPSFGDAITGKNKLFQNPRSVKTGNLKLC